MMTLFCLGLSYRHTALEIRERLFMAEPELIPFLQGLGTVLEEIAVVSTCNRLEIYAACDDIDYALEAVFKALSDQFNIPEHELRVHFNLLQDQFAVGHLMRVASGLDSMILGESQILGQVADAIHTAQKAGSSGAVLSRLFEMAVHAGKRARTETPIGQHSVSVSHAAARLVMDLMTGPEQRVLLVGAGEMAELAAQALKDRGLSSFRIVNRTLEHARRLADHLNVEAIDWSAMWPTLEDTDIVVCCTGAPHTVVFASDVERVMSKRPGRPLVFVDIAVPRDVETSVGQINGVTCYEIDDLQRVMDEGLSRRRESIPRVEAIIAEEQARFSEWQNSRQIVPVITDLRRKLQTVADQELRHTMNRLSHLDARDQALVGQLVHRIVNKVLHDPTMTLRERAGSGDTEVYTQIVRDLFSLVNAEELSSGK